MYIISYECGFRLPHQEEADQARARCYFAAADDGAAGSAGVCSASERHAHECAHLYACSSPCACIGACVGARVGVSVRACMRACVRACVRAKLALDLKWLQKEE